MVKLTKREEILKLRVAEQVLQDVIDNLTEELESIEEALRERGEVPESNSDMLEEEENGQGSGSKR